MQVLTVKVFAGADEIASVDVDVDDVYDNRGREVIDEEGEFTDFQKALIGAAPQMCPWDCDHCRG